MRIAICLFVAGVFACIITQAQQLVGSFGPRVRGYPEIHSFAETQDNGILITGYFDFFSGSESGALIKMTMSGESFPGFNKVICDGAITQAVALPSGKILVQGTFTTINGHSATNLSRLNADGTFDNTFSVPHAINNFAVQSDGKIIVSQPDKTISRLNPDGAPDGTFTTSSLLFTMLLAVDAQDRIYCGDFNSVIRLSANGVPDNAFAIHTTTGGILSIAPQGDKLLVGGSFTDINGVPINRIGRINNDGSPDASFAIGTGPTDGTVYDIDTTPSGTIVVSGVFAAFSGVPASVLELETNGAIHATSAQTYPRPATLIKKFSNGKTLVAGNFSSPDRTLQSPLSMFESNSNPDTQFTADVTYSSGGYDYFPGPVLDSKGRIVLADGEAQIRNIIGMYDQSVPVSRMVFRLNADGTFDPMFTPPLPGLSSIMSTAIAPGDKLLLGGSHIGTQQSTLVQWNEDGTEDNSFVVHTDVGSSINQVIVADNKIYIAGRFSQVNGTPSNCLAVLDLAGNLTKSFSNITSNPDGIMGIRLQPDGKILIAFLDPAYPNTKLVRLDAAGAPDATFATVVLDGIVLDIEVDAANRIYCTGQFGIVNGQLKKSVVRLSPNGTIDNTFSTGIGFQGYVSDATILADGRIAIGGRFNSYRGIPISGIAIVNESGLLSGIQLPFNKNSWVPRMTASGKFIFGMGRIILNNFSRVISLVKIDTESLLRSPENLAVTVSEAGVVRLTWDDKSDNETGFTIERAVESEAFVAVGTVNANMTTFSQEAGIRKQCTYRVYATQSGVESERSNSVTAYWDPVPASPTNLSLSSDESRVTVVWEYGASDQISFIVQRKVVDTFVNAGDIPAGTHVFIDNKVVTGTKYSYRVMAKNQYATSDPSESKDITISVVTATEDLRHAARVFPNPADNFVTVTFSGAAQLEVLDAHAHVLTTSIRFPDDHSAEIDFSELQRGLYLVVIRQGDTVSVKKVMRR